MGKGANAGGPQAKAEAKRKAAGAPEKGDPTPKAAAAKDAKAPKAKEADAGPTEAESAKAKLAEEARQKWADDDRDERLRIELRSLNRQAKANGWQLTGSRDKSIARVTRFQNRLKLFKGDAELDGVYKDIDGVDASKYVSELAECIMEAAGVSVKLKELSSVTKVCSRLHGTYEDFGAHLARALERAWGATPAGDLNRRRFLLRLCAELCLVECVAAERAPLLAMVRELSDVSQPEEQLATSFTIISSLAQKHAPSCLSIVPGKQKAYEEALGKPWVERACVLGEALRVQLMQLVVNAYQNSAAGLLQGAHARLVEQEKVNSRLRVDKGQVDAENEQRHQQLKEGLAKLQLNLATLSEHLNQPMPVAQEEDPGVSRIEGRRDGGDEGAQEEVLQAIWEDAEQQRFYEEVLDPRDVIPAVLLGGGKAARAAEKASEKADAPAEEAAAREDAKDAKDSKEPKEPKEAREAREAKEAREAREAKEPPAPADAAQRAEQRAEQRAQLATDFELYLARVSKAESAKQVDDIVVEFFHDFNNKANRRGLAQHLLGVHRSKLHLLAPHARLAAIVAPYLKEVPALLLQGLQYELEQLLAEKDPIAIESKVRTVRFLCELCKFRVCPPGVILDTFKAFCDDFSQHHAELCTHLLQCCGRFLLYTPETAVRTDNLLELMMRLKNAKSLPLRLEIMLEDAYYQVKPPESKRKKERERDPLELFTQSLVFERLYREDDEDRVLKLVRKLPWDGPAPAWLRRCLLDLNMHANYESLYLIASLLSGLAKYRDAFVIGVIDTLFENIQATLERNDFREMPLRVRQAKLLGELYNYRLVDSALVFDAMYQLIGMSGPTAHRAGQAATAHRVLERALAARRGGLGPVPEEGEEGAALPAVLADPQHPVEAPWDYFRIKLVCVLLETCGHYFDHGADRLRLDRFLHFFARYVHSKGDLPLRFMNMVHDTLERLRPKLVFPTRAAAEEAVLRLLRQERETLDLGEGRAEDDAGDGAGEEESSEDEDSGSEDEGSSEEEEEGSSEEESDSEDDDEGAYDRGETAAGKHQEELDEFDRDLQQLLIDSLESEKHKPRILQEIPAPPPASKRPDTGAEPGTFSLMQKRGGGKVALKQIEIPDDSKLMRASRTHEGEADKEQADLKRYIMQSVQNPVQAIGGAPSGRPYEVRLRAGKGGHKGQKGRRSAEYVRDEFLPEEERAEQAPQTHVPTRGGKGGKGGHSWGWGGGGSKGGWGGGGGGARQRADLRGTPSAAAVRGAL